MRISEAIAVLRGFQEDHGDLKIEAITGFWAKDFGVPSAEMVVVPSVGDGRSVADVLGVERAFVNNASRR